MIRSLMLIPMLAACVAVAPPGAVTRGAGPPDAVAGACYARGVSPAVIETVTDQVLEQGAVRDADGRILAPARFRTETRTRIVRDRRETWFQTPCALRDEEPGFVMQVQRALAARGLYDGPAHGAYDRETRAAVRSFQTAQGIESGTLSITAARSLGLVALGRDGA